MFLCLICDFVYWWSWKWGYLVMFLYWICDFACWWSFEMTFKVIFMSLICDLTCRSTRLCWRLCLYAWFATLPIKNPSKLRLIANINKGKSQQKSRKEFASRRKRSPTLDPGGYLDFIPTLIHWLLKVMLLCFIFDLSCWSFWEMTFIMAKFRINQGGKRTLHCKLHLYPKFLN